MENLKDLCVNNSASILTGLGVVGVIGTAVVTAKLTPKALDILEEREKLIMELRYGFNGKKELTQKEVADKLGISQSYISRIEKKVLSKLKSYIS